MSAAENAVVVEQAEQNLDVKVGAFPQRLDALAIEPKAVVAQGAVNFSDPAHLR